MVDYGLKNRVALITGTNNPQGIGATTALAFAREGAKVAMVYKKIERPFDNNKTDRNGADMYYAANAGNADIVESKLREMDADYIVMESDISDESAVKEIYSATMERYGRIDILVNNAAVDDERIYQSSQRLRKDYQSFYGCITSVCRSDYIWGEQGDFGSTYTQRSS